MARAILMDIHFRLTTDSNVEDTDCDKAVEALEDLYGLVEAVLTQAIQDKGYDGTVRVQQVA